MVKTVHEAVALGKELIMERRRKTKISARLALSNSKASRRPR